MSVENKSGRQAAAKSNKEKEEVLNRIHTVNEKEQSLKTDLKEIDDSDKGASFWQTMKEKDPTGAGWAIVFGAEGKFREKSDRAAALREKIEPYDHNSLEGVDESVSAELVAIEKIVENKLGKIKALGNFLAGAMDYIKMNNPDPVDSGGDLEVIALGGPTRFTRVRLFVETKNLLSEINVEAKISEEAAGIVQKRVTPVLNKVLEESIREIQRQMPNNAVMQRFASYLQAVIA